MFVISLGIVCVFGGVAFGDIIHVPSEYSTIQAGIDAASNSDTVLVADGVYMGEGNRDLVFGGKIITVQSENGPVKSIIDCEGVGRAFSSYPNTSTRDVVFRGFTIRNGVANRGGAIYWGYTSANLTVEDCIFHNNSNEAENGGAIRLSADSFPTISNSILWSYTPDEISGDGVPTVTYSDIQGGYIGEGNMDEAPLFMDITDPDHVNKSQPG